MAIKRNGGMWFWQVGKFGGSFYRKTRSKSRALVVYKPPFWTARRKELATDIAFMVTLCIVWVPVIIGLFS